MADYFPVISRAIAGLDPNTGETRRAVYERARAAIVRQLRAIEPPVPEDEIARQCANLEQAIGKVEAEHAARDAAPEAPKAAAAVAAPKPAGTAAPASSPKPGGGSAPKPEPARSATGADAARDKPAPSGPRPDGSTGGKPSEVGSPGDKASAPKPSEAKPSEAKPSEFKPSGSKPQRSATRPDGRPIVRTQAPVTRAGATNRSTAVVALVALAVIAVGAGLFVARGHIAALFSGGHVAETARPSGDGEQTGRAAAPSNGESKSADRLSQDDSAAAKPDGDKPAAGAPPQDRQAAAAPAQPPAEPAQPGPLVAQRAMLYEEGPNQQSGEALAGTVLWRTESVSGGANQPLETALKGDIDIPGRNVKATLTLRRNIDATLPASHTIEIQFILPGDFPNAGISNVPGVLMKTDEAARGAAVAGLSVRVTNGFFLVGLSNLDSERMVNEQLLKERGWIDIPILYENGRRAVLTLEKGTPGTQAFNQAFDAWKSASPTAANPPR